MTKPPGSSYSPDELSNLWGDLRGEGMTHCPECGTAIEDTPGTVCDECDTIYREDYK